MIYGRLIQRYKRFLADIELEDGSVVTAHCPNSGRMTGCATPGWMVAISESDNPKRKLKYTLEYVHNGVSWICVHAAHANKVALRGIQEGLIPELEGYDRYSKEVVYGEKSRVDIFAQNHHGEKNNAYIEVKSCTMVGEDGQYTFPDAPTTRGQKHIKELLVMVKKGFRGVMLFIIQREDGCGFVPAWQIDPVYASLLEEAQGQGLEILCYQCSVDPHAQEAVRVVRPVTFQLGQSQ